MYYFNQNDERWNLFFQKMKIVAICGSEKETPLFIPTLLQLVNGNNDKIFKIERHVYNLKREDKAIENPVILEKIESFLK